MKDEVIDQNCQQIEELSLSLENEKKEKENTNRRFFGQKEV